MISLIDSPPVRFCRSKFGLQASEPHRTYNLWMQGGLHRRHKPLAVFCCRKANDDWPAGKPGISDVFVCLETMLIADSTPKSISNNFEKFAF